MEIIQDFKDYEKCKSFLQSKNLLNETDKSWRFYEGRQWGDNVEGFPIVNIITPIVKFKTGLICQNGMSLHFEGGSVKNPHEKRQTEEIVGKMNDLVASVYEKTQFDNVLWDVVEEACVSGLAVLYSYFDPDLKEIRLELKSSPEVLFGNEQEEDVEEQPFILIPYRDMVENVIGIAKSNNVKEEEISLITSDQSLDFEVGDHAKKEVETEKGKCLCILKLWKENGEVFMKKFTKNCEFFPKTNTHLKRYPVAVLPWGKQKGWIRGTGEVFPLIPNQVEINKHYARRSVIAKNYSYPKMVVRSDYVENFGDIENVGAVLEVDGAIEDLGKVISYLNFPPMNTDPEKLSKELISVSKENAGASDVALGNVNVEKTSGRAILAVQESAAVFLNRQVAHAKNFVEKVGRIWWDLMFLNSPYGVEVEREKTFGEETIKVKEKITQEEISKVDLSLKIDVSSKSPFSKFAREQTLENHLMGGFISYEDYVTALDEDSVSPKEKLLKILENKKEREILANQIKERDQVIQNLLGALENVNSERDERKQKYDELSSVLPLLEEKGKNFLQNLRGKE